jgi:hypothetical protein
MFDYLEVKFVAVRQREPVFLERTIPFSSGAELVTLDHLLSCGIIQPHWDKQVDLEPPVERDCYRCSSWGSLRRFLAAKMASLPLTKCGGLLYSCCCCGGRDAILWAFTGAAVGAVLRWVAAVRMPSFDAAVYGGRTWGMVASARVWTSPFRWSDKTSRGASFYFLEREGFFWCG